MDREDNRSKIRDRDWLYGALWAICGDKDTHPCRMELPVTVIFNEGLPFKAVQTGIDSGCIERLDLSHERFVERELGEGAFQGLPDLRLRALRKVLLEFLDQNKFDEVQQHSGAEETFFAKVNAIKCNTTRIYSFIFTCIAIATVVCLFVLWK
jgi:hypothetical protein